MAQHASAHAHDGAPHTNYVKIWAILLVLLFVSVIGPEFGIRIVTLITAFGIAIVKAWMVAKYFMHLNIERTWVAYIRRRGARRARTRRTELAEAVRGAGTRQRGRGAPLR